MGGGMTQIMLSPLNINGIPKIRYPENYYVQ